MDLMLDLETLGTLPTAVVVQIAIVQFDPRTMVETTYRETCIEPQSELDLGCTVSGPTLSWWFLQPAATRDYWLKPRISPLNSHDAWSFISNGLQTWAYDRIWCHTCFDMPIVDYHLNAWNLPLPDYRKWRDIRTLVDLSNMDLEEWKHHHVTMMEHNALQDCRRQIHYCHEALMTVKGNQQNGK